MKLSLQTLDQSVPALQTLIKSDKIPAQIGFRLDTLIDELETHMKKYAERRLATFKKYGDEINGQIQVRIEETLEFQKEMTALLEEEVEVNIPQIVKDDIAKVEISVEKLKSLKWLWAK